MSRSLAILGLLALVFGTPAAAQLPDPDDPSRKPGMFQCGKDRER